MGLSFSVPEGEKLPSSLLNIFKELQKDVGCSIPRHGNLQKWAVQVKWRSFFDHLSLSLSLPILYLLLGEDQANSLLTFFFLGCFAA